MGVFAAAFILTFLGELADKSRFAAVLLSVTFPRPAPVWVGMTAAYAFLNGAAVLLGAALPLPDPWPKVGAGVALLACAWLSSRPQADVEAAAAKWLERSKSRGPLLASFGLTAALELGDRTQLAAAALAAFSGRPVVVFAGAVSAAAALNAATLLVGPAPLSSRGLRAASVTAFLAASLWVAAR